MVASLLPKDVNLNVNNLDSLTDEQLLARLRRLTREAAPLLAKAAEPREERAGSLPALIEKSPVVERRLRCQDCLGRPGSGSLARSLDRLLIVAD